jgi:hypothetical protein
MKKIIAFILLISAAITANAQAKLSDQDFNNLLALADLYSHDNMCSGVDFVQTANSLRTPVLNHIVDVLITMGKADSALLEKGILARPEHDELVLWYVIREVHYNRIDSAQNKPSASEVAKKVLSENIDERWLVHNYYYFQHGGFGMYFNKADLSRVNINVDSLGLKDKTERGIFFLNMIDALIRGRFLVLSHLKKYDLLMSFSRKMPQFNGKPYFYYTDLDFPDFNWSGFKSTDTYKQSHIGDLIGTLAAHFAAMANTYEKGEARELYFNSILHRPEFFKYSTQSEKLQKIYDRAK